MSSMRDALKEPISITILLALLLALVPSTSVAVQACNPNYARGIRGTIRVRVAAIFRYPREVAGAIEIAERTFTRVVQEDAVKNSAGPQFVFVEDRSADIDVNVLFYAGDDGSKYWAEIAASGMREGGWLFDVTTRSHGPGDHLALVTEAAHKFYQFVAYGWTCSKVRNDSSADQSAAERSHRPSGELLTFYDVAPEHWKESGKDAAREGGSVVWRASQRRCAA